MSRPPTVPDPPASPEAAGHAWLAVVRAYHLCGAVLSARVADLGLRLAEHEVLIVLLRSPALTQQELARRCFVAKSGISMLVTRMEQAKWVQRRPDPVDARVRRLTLTARGRALALQAQQLQSEVVAAMTGDASAAEIAAIDAAMQRASQALLQMLPGSPATGDGDAEAA